MDTRPETVIRPAAAADLPAVIGLLEEAAIWVLDTYGLDQWPTQFPVGPVQAAIERGSMHVAESAGEVVGTMDLIWDDPLFWGEREDAGFVHRLSSRRSSLGQQIGQRMLDWGAEQIAARGRSSQCLDVMYENRGLRDYYERLGFDLVGERSLETPQLPLRANRLWRAALYQRHVG